jgi:hypothetical protein
MVRNAGIKPGASASVSYGAQGATQFVGQAGGLLNAQSFFTGFMTEQLHVGSYSGDMVRGAYFNFSGSLSSAWLGMDEFNLSTKSMTFVYNPTSPTSFSNNPTTMQNVASNGATVSADAYLFQTGTQVPTGTEKPFACAYFFASCPTSYTYSFGSDVRIATQLPIDTTPVSVQMVVNGSPDIVHSWSVPATGWEDIIDAGTVITARGTYSVYTITKFADSNTAQSNTITIAIS